MSFMSLRKPFFLCAVCLCVLSFSSCSKSLGYGVLLWGNEEHGLTDGTVLKVHIKSNISQVYVVSVVGSKEKFELPLWQITEPSGKRAALRQKERFAECEHTYASVKLDGLPIRAEAVNTSRQVYRLRENEIIRCLYKGEGAAVTNGHGNMRGEWLRVLTETGTYGWCFSYNLELFKAGARVVFSDSGENPDVLKVAEVDSVLESVLAKQWYPQYFAGMISDKRIDIGRMNASFGFDFGISEPDDVSGGEEGFAAEKNDGRQNGYSGYAGVAGTAKITLEDGTKSWAYSGIERSGNREYEFTGSPLKMTVRDADTILIQFMEKGKVRIEAFTAISESIEELVEREMFRRQDELVRIASAGPVFKSSNYGTIEFNNENSVTWRNYKLLVPTLISRNALGSVSVSIDCFISDSLKSSYDGVITMHFVGMEYGIRFLYKLTDTGLRLEDATKSPVRNGVITARSASPMVLFFEKSGS